MRSFLRFLAILAAVGAAAEPAFACGGTFCDTGPTAMPVDQSGENILFVVGDGRIQAHVQIQYEGDASRFAWVIPVPAIPDIRVGSQALFTNLLNATVPTFGLNGSLTCNNLAINGGGGDVGGLVQDPAPAQVVKMDTVGAFEVTIVEGTTGESIVNWLRDNDYEQIPEAAALFDEYVGEGMLFAAIKLTAGAATDEIHPLIFDYEGDEPTIPIKLTSVAATDDLALRTFVLGETRYVPENYAHLVLNSARIDWTNFATNYVEVVTKAADEDAADGQAFVTEFAGPSTIVQQTGIVDTRWDASPLVNVALSDLMAVLEEQGVIVCGAGACTPVHPLILSLIQKHVPVPEGFAADDFYSCIGCYEATHEPLPWDPGAFAADYQERIVIAGRDALRALTDAPYLTRLFTTISPDEMTLDPVFAPRDELEDVGAFQTAQPELGCGQPSNVLRLPDGNQAALTETLTWPEFDDEMPWALRVESFADAGEPAVLVDNTDLIADQLAAWNESQGVTISESGVPTFNTIDVGDDGTVEPTSNTSAGGTTAGSASAGAMPMTDVSESPRQARACGVAMGAPDARGGTAIAWALALLGWMSARVRRRWVV